MLEIIVSSPLFDYGCIIAAVFLCLSAPDNLKTCHTIIMSEFIACKIASVFVLTVFALREWEIYAAYGVVQLVAMLAFFVAMYNRKQLSLLIVIMVGVAGVLNLNFAFSWVNSGDDKSHLMPFYNIYSLLFGFIMLFQLLFMYLSSQMEYSRRRYGRTITERFFNVFTIMHGRADAGRYSGGCR